MSNEQLDNEYSLIPMSEITKDVRLIAVRWCEGFEDWMRSDLPHKHKLASDIMNYANHQNAELQEEIRLMQEVIRLQHQVLMFLHNDAEYPTEWYKIMIEAKQQLEQFKQKK